MHLTKPTNNIIWKNITCINELTKLKEQWQKLADNCKDGLFTSPKWILPWLETYWQDSWKLRVIIGFENGELTVFIPFYSQPHCYNLISILYPLGQGEPENEEISSEYQDILIDPKSFCSIIDITHQILKINYTAIYWRSLLSKSNWLKFKNNLPSFNQYLLGYRYLLNTDKEQCLSKNAKTKWGRLQKKLDRNNAKFFWMENDSVNNYWDNLIELHTSRWKKLDQLGAFSKTQFSMFHKKFIQENETKVSVLKINNQVIAINYYLVNNQTLYFYQSGWELTYKQYSPGFCLHQWSIENNSARNYDFMMGSISNSYKSMYGCNTLDEMYSAEQIRHPYIHYIFRFLQKLIYIFCFVRKN